MFIATISLGPAFCTILVIILIAGALGGAANYFLDKEADTFHGYTLWRRVFLGIIAAGIVPLMLYFLRSDLIKFDDKATCEALVDNCPSLWVFTAMCLLAGAFSSRFLQVISDKLFKRLEEAEQKAEQAHKTATAADKLAGQVLDASAQQVPEGLAGLEGMRGREGAAGDLKQFIRQRIPVVSPVRLARPGGYSEEVVRGVAEELVREGEYELVVRNGRDYYVRRPEVG